MRMKHASLWIALITPPLTACGSLPLADSSSLNASAIKQIVDGNMQPFLANNHALGRSSEFRRRASASSLPMAPLQMQERSLLPPPSSNSDPAPKYSPPHFFAGDHAPKAFLNWASSWIPYLPGPYVYSNPSVGLLAYLVRQATGQLWQDQIDTEITKPLGMVDTEEIPTAEQMERMAQGHPRDGSGAKKSPDYAWYGAGALRSTAVDMLRSGKPTSCITKSMVNPFRTS
jgi:hypothetical protein